VIDPVRYPDYLLQSKRALMATISQAEFKAQIADYLKTLKPGYPKSLDDLADWANDPKRGYRSPEKAFAFKFSQSFALDLTDPVYLAAKNEGTALVTAAISGLFAEYKLDAIVYPTSPVPALPYAGGGPSSSPDSATNFANLTGFPDLIVPAGMTKDGLPVTISFFGPAFSEPKLLGYGFDFEQAANARALPKFTPPLAGETIFY